MYKTIEKAKSRLTGNPGMRRAWCVALLAAVGVFAVALPLHAQQVEAVEPQPPNAPRDTDIARALETDLMMNENLMADKIDVNVVDGIVTLSGTVDDLLARDRAGSVAKTVRGVRAVVNELTVEPADKRDATLKNDVTWALLRDPVADSWEVDVQVENGVVTLEGSVGSWTEKQFAENVAKGVSGVRDIENNLDWSVTAERPDADIQAEIQRALEYSVWIDEALIDVDLDDGHVTLSGAVGSSAEKSRAITKAWVAGVTSVNHEDLEVQWWTRDAMRRREKYTVKSDEAVEQAVQDAFLYDPEVLSFSIDAEVNDGSVTLTGTVDTLSAKRAAEQDANNVVGVYRVTNLIKVRPTETPTDDEVRNDVVRALTINPIVERYDIDVKAVNGRVYLNGRVDSAFEREQAEDIAARQRGVIEVVNLLDISDWDWQSDYEIKENIKSQFFWSPFVDGDDIEITVEDGVATLQGEVDTPGEHQSAIENAYEGGARSVDSRLEIQYSPDYHVFSRGYYPYAGDYAYP